MLLVLLACSGSPDPADPADSGHPDDTAPAVPVDCDAVTGTGSVVLLGRAVDASPVLPTAAPEVETQPTGFAGPDALGRYYLAELTGVVRRSDDGGCAWREVGLLPGGRGEGGETETADTGPGPGWVYYDLFATGGRVYAYSPGTLLVSTDGVDWTRVAEVSFRAPAQLVADPADPDRLRSYGAEGVVTSTDAGATWSATPAPDPDVWYNVGIDAADIDRVALGRRGVWVTDDGGATWTTRSYDGSPLPAWDDGALYAFNHGGDDDADYHLRKSTDAGATFNDLPIGNDPTLSLSELGVDAGLVVTGGYRYVSGEPVEGVIQRTTASGNGVVRVPGYEGVVGIAFGDDRVLVALMGPSVETPD